MKAAYKLNYAKIRTQIITAHEFSKHYQMIDFIDEICYNRKDKVVWLVSKDDLTDVFISESYLSIQDFLSRKSLFQSTGDYFLQEYDSFEEAYKVAHMMTELSPLCYSNDNQNLN